ncbi:MAG TPA: sigma-E processing peptidase SpoIIGA [Limnochordia bacterium]|jgi:stage II sporulation protein GA (sporulation sigma-E factor processing peptidase)|nr:sigma-E processing peptidase SpoIIGA [Limnochordia bacterium]
MPDYTLYVDVWLLRLGCNFVFEYLLLWATATITHATTRPSRLALGSLLGTFHYFLYLLASVGLIRFYGLLRFLPIVLLVSLAMIFVTFYPMTWKRLWSVAGHFYGIGFIAAGVGMAAAYALGSSGSPQFTVGTLVSIFAILLIAELGWGVVHETVVNRVYRVPVEIWCDGVQVQMTALVDTGNHLKDPLNRQSVIIVDKDALTNLLPASLTTIVSDLGEGIPEAIDHLEEIAEWQTRVRLIPFSSIGKSNGLLIGFRPDEVTIGGHTLPKYLQPTVAVHPYRLDPEGEYMALVPPILVEGSLHAQKGGETHAKATSADI